VSEQLPRNKNIPFPFSNILHNINELEVLVIIIVMLGEIVSLLTLFNFIRDQLNDDLLMSNK